MTLASDLITDAFREGNLIPVGTTPTPAEQAEALRRLNRFMLSVYGTMLGENMLDWPVPQPQRTATILAQYPQAPYPMSIDAGVQAFPYSQDATVAIWPYPPKNSRIIWGRTTQTVFFPEQPDPGSRMALVSGSGAGDNGQVGAVLTLDGNGRLIDGAAKQTYTDPIPAAALPPQQWLYREDLGSWTTVKELALTDNMPWPEEIDDLWTTGLIIRLAPRFGKTIPPETSTTYTNMVQLVKQRYRQSAVTIYGSFDFPRSLQSYIAGQWFW